MQEKEKLATIKINRKLWDEAKEYLNKKETWNTVLEEFIKIRKKRGGSHS